MSSIGRTGNLYLDHDAGGILFDARSPCPPVLKMFVRLFAVSLVAATLAACAQSSVVTNKTVLRAANRQSSLVAASAKKQLSFGADRRRAGTELASYGLASFYTEGSRTASGEKFNPNELTAAHPTLPFGTRLRVTNVATGRSVTVRINDRGPFIAGRVVDVSYSAAARLGITGQGVAKVKLDVVQ
jgi:rare lipoprotein A